MCVEIVYFPGYGVLNFEINLTLVIKLFFYMNKNSRQKINYFENEKNFLRLNKKTFLFIFKEVSIAKYYLRPASSPSRLGLRHHWTVPEVFSKET